jgi:hypothetical protein
MRDTGTNRERSVHHDGTHDYPWVKVFDPRCWQVLKHALNSTLAIWPANTPHRLGLLPSPWDFLRVGLPLQHAKSPLKTWAVLAETF